VATILHLRPRWPPRGRAPQPNFAEPTGDDRGRDGDLLEDPPLIRRHLFALRLMLIAADGIVATLLFLGIGQLRFGDAMWTTLWQAFDIDVGAGALLYACAWVMSLWFLGMYDLRIRWTMAGELYDILVASFVLAFGTMSFLFLSKVDVSRLFLMLLLVTQPLVTTAGRLVLRLFFNWLRARGYNRCYMVVVGTGGEAQSFADAIERHRELGIEIVGHVRAPGEEAVAITRPVLGDAEALGSIFHERVVDEVAICADSVDPAWAEALIRLAASEGKHVRVPTRIQARSLDRQSEELDGLLIRSFVHGPARMVSLALKRAMDVAGAAVGLVVLAPVFAVAALAILVTDCRPVFYHQTRLGLQGRPFTLHKFRSMARDADARFDEVQHLNERAGIVFKSEADPRITRVGRILRATSIDELPQLWNVLRGEMSLVGPRPPLEREIAQYDIWHRRRLSMKPGISGLWQVEARAEPEFDRWVERDLDYIDRWSLALDFQILLKTVPAVVGRTGK
jgi:exopolysaccharide biosynthesis polyprenyl glycosylphosphotransferase